MTRRRFLSGALSCTLAPFCRAEPVFSVRFTRTRTRLVVVPVLVGATRLSFVLDTGSGSSIISTEAIERLAPGEFQPRGRMSVQFAGGKAQAQWITLPSVAVAGGEPVRLDAASLSLTRHREELGAAVDGFLGMDLLTRYGLRIDLQGPRLDLLPSEAELKPDDSVEFELDRERKILFSAQVQGRPVTALLDTGAARSVVNWAASEQAGVGHSAALAERNILIGGDGALLATHEYTFRVRAGSLSWNLPLMIVDVPAFESMGFRDKPCAILGMDLLDGHGLIVTFANKRLAIY
jgi:predicted aspartyl protease